MSKKRSETGDEALQAEIEELKNNNEILALAVQRSRLSVKRLKLEYSVLLERLEYRVDIDPELSIDTPLPTLEAFRQELLNKPIKKTKSKRQKLKERDPNMPKRPTNAYLLYCEMNKEKYRQMGSHDVTRDLTESWKKLNEQDRQPYYTMYNEDRKRYQKEMIVYNRKNNIPAPVRRQNSEHAKPNESRNLNDTDEMDDEEEDGEKSSGTSEKLSEHFTNLNETQPTADEDDTENEDTTNI